LLLLLVLLLLSFFVCFLIRQVGQVKWEMYKHLIARNGDQAADKDIAYPHARALLQFDTRGLPSSSARKYKQHQQQKKKE
jgi:hypothetical protein